ncbi:MAG: ATP-binding protein, partial [Nitrosomonas sp.]|nr:ATP-binding protein [Nitrosomonas sp.]
MKTFYPEQFWHSLFYFNIYRLVMASGIVISSWLFHPFSFGNVNEPLFNHVALVYVLLCGLTIIPVRKRYPNFNWQLSFQIVSDVVFICIMIFASGGIQSGLGVLLLVSLAGAGLISRGRLALFYAAVASIGLLLQETYALLYVYGYQAQYTHVGLLSMGYFALAWLAHQLATRAIASEQLARQRGSDLANMAQVNQLVIQDMQDGVLVVDGDGKIRQRNFIAEKLLGLEPKLSAFEYPVLEDYVPSLAERLVIWLEDNDTNFDLLKLPTSHVLVRTRFVPIKENSRTGVVIFLEDMSRIQAQVQQLKLASLGRLTANIAHEIRNPLSAISHAAELLAEEQSSDPMQARLLQIVRDNTLRLDKIVQDILQLNRRDIAESEILDAAAFVRNFVNDFCRVEKIDADIFLLEVAGQNSVAFDQAHLNRVLWNLCRNAWRHCRKKKASILLRLTDGVDANCINLDVIDDGPGVSPAQLRKLFEPFFTTETSGTGLGLYIAREMC